LAGGPAFSEATLGSASFGWGAAEFSFLGAAYLFFTSFGIGKN